jgi:hypothetical protein
MAARLTHSLVVAFVVLTVATCGNAAAAVLLPQQTIVRSISGPFAYGTPASYKATSLNRFNLATGEESIFDLPAAGGAPASRSSLNEVVGSAWGMAATRATEDGTKTLLSVSNAGAVKVVQSWPYRGGSCGEYFQLRDVDDAGNITILRLALRLPATRPKRADPSCKVDVQQTSLYRVSPDGEQRKLWLPRKYKTLLNQADLQSDGELATVSIPGGSRYGPRSRVFMLDLKRHRELRRFRAAQPFDEVKVSLGEGAYAVTRTKFPHRRDRDYPSTSVSFASTGSKTARFLNNRAGYFSTSVCGRRLALQTGPPWAPSGIEFIDRYGNTLLTQSYASGHAIASFTCGADFALSSVDRQFNETPASPDDGYHVFDLRTLAG